MLKTFWRKRRVSLIAVAISCGVTLLLIGAIDATQLAATVAAAPHRVLAAALSAVAVLFALSATALMVMMSMVRRNRRISAALDNMTQGLCMFDSSARLIICNDPYLEMYGITREHAYPGCPLRELLEYRQATGTFFQDIDEYVEAARRRVIDGKVFNNIVEVRGRIISISKRPSPGGGWVSTHEDITEQRRHDQQRDLLAAQEERRGAVEAAIAAFRTRAETMLRTVGGQAVAMRSTAATLFAASNRTSQRAEGAVDT
jgi:methyl-accepting chemotaxis protein